MCKKNVKKVAVTGATGFLGSNFIEKLKERDEYYVYAFSSCGEEMQKDNKSRNIRFFHKDAFFSNNSFEILKDAFIVNCAFPRNSAGTGIADGLCYIHDVFNMSRTAGAKAIINISSQSVYSQKRNKLATEGTQVCLESSYAVGKFATELMLEDACRGTNMVYTNLRMASLIGPGFDQRIVNRLINQAIKDKTIRIMRSEQKFGFLDIEDAVKALILLLETNIMKWKPIYNVGNGKEYSIEYIAHQIKTVFESNGLTAPKVNVETGDACGNTGVAYNTIHEDCGFEPSIDIDTSIQRILNQIIVN